MKGSEPTLFQLLEHTAEQLAEFDYKTAAVSGKQGQSTSQHPRPMMHRMLTTKQMWAAEDEEMEKITQKSKTDFEGCDAKLRGTWLRILTVYFGALPIAIALLALAYLHEGAFESTSKLVFYSSIVWVAWVPLRDTAALAVLAHSKARVRWFNALQVATPITMAGLSWLSTTVDGTRKMDRLSSNVIIATLGQLVIYIGLPLILFYLRVKTARELEVMKEKGRIVKVDDAELRRARSSVHQAVQKAPDESTVEDESTSKRSSLSLSPAFSAKGTAKSSRAALGIPAFGAKGTAKSSSRAAHKSAKVAPATVVMGRGAGPMSALDVRQFTAAAKLQSRVRMKRARRKYKEKVTERQVRLRYFSLPIFFSSVGDIIGNSIILDRMDRQELGPEWALYSIVLCTLPCIIILIIDLAKPRNAPTMAKRRPRFSIAHAIFLVAVLGRLATKAATIDAAREHSRSNAAPVCPSDDPPI